MIVKKIYIILVINIIAYYWDVSLSVLRLNHIIFYKFVQRKTANFVDHMSR